ncbi:MAG: PEGA domain-containing protein [Candidatus Aminicenantes bacterium]|nr:PEGA domain-containing protein [Candidatus Aminicenantes bacterium]
MRKIVTVMLLVCISIAFSGCAAIFKGSNSSLDASSDPSGAKVYVNGELFGKTPITLRLKSSKTYTLEFKKEGYETVTRNISSSVGAGWIILDILAGLVPVIIDAATGSWYSLDQDHVNAILEEQQ